MTKFSNRIKKSAKQSRIILANDYPRSTSKLEERTIKNIKTLGEYICGIKLNFHLLLPLGKKEIKRITRTAHDFGIQTIADIKLNDIGNTNIVTSENLFELGFDAVIVNPIMGPDALGKLVTFSHKNENGLITLCHMSPPEAKISYELSVNSLPKPRTTTKLYKLFLDWAINKKVDGIIVGATYPDIIKFCKNKVGTKLQIYSPGIGTQGGDASAVKLLGSDFLIVGRTILNANNPTQVAKKLAVDSIL